jgi:hypothetical protein
MCDMKKILFCIIGCFIVLPLGADNVTTTKPYVDYHVGQKQDKIPGIPSEYTPVEYIESRVSTAQAYIDTGLNFNSNYIYEITYEKGGLQNAFMGARASTNYQAKGNFALTYKNSTCVYSSTSTNSTGVDFGDTTFGIKHTVKYQQSTSTLLFDNQNKWNSNWITNVEIPYNVYLFAFNQGGSPGGARSVYARIYTYSVKNSNGTFIQNFIPAKNSSDVVGMYDTVSGTFFENDGAGSFVAGPEGVMSILTYGATDGSIGSAIITDQIGTDTTESTIPTTGAVVTGLNDKMATLPANTAYVMAGETANVAGTVQQKKPVY